MRRSSPTRMPAVFSAALVLLALCTPRVHAAASDTVISWLDSTDHVSFGPSMVAIAAIALGMALCLAGYKLFRAAIFLSGFVAGGIVIAKTVEHFAKNKSWMVTASWVGFVVGGLLLAFVAMLVYEISVFIAGSAVGVGLAWAINTALAYKIYPSEPNIVFIALAVILGLACGIAAVKVAKPMTIVITSLVGAVGVAWGVGVFAEGFPSVDELKSYFEDVDEESFESMPDAWWGYLATIVVLFIAGMFVQFRRAGCRKKPSRAAAQGYHCA